jgi:hypothetical protein
MPMSKKYVVKYDPIVAGTEVREFVLKRLIDEICRMEVPSYGFTEAQTNKILSILGIESEETEEPKPE